MQSRCRFLSLPLLSALFLGDLPAQGVQAISLGITHATADPGTLIGYVGRVRGNESRMASPTAKYGIYLSTNRNITTGDTLVASGTVRSLGFFITRKVSGSFRLQATRRPGTVHVGLFLDHTNQLRERNENDNTTSRPLTINAAVDLQMSSATVLTTPRVSGTNVALLLQVTNRGNVTAGTSSQPMRVGFFLGKSAARDEADVFLGDAEFIVAGGRSVSRQLGVRLPAGIAGQYYLRAVADYVGAIEETDEQNNVRAHRIDVLPVANDARFFEWIPKHTGLARSYARATMPTTSGGSGDLVVAAPELAGGDYLCVIACSETFGIDACSGISFSLMNGPILPRWFGQLSGDGLAHPAVNFPKLPPVQLTLYLHALARKTLANPFAPITEPVQLRLISPRGP